MIVRSLSLILPVLLGAGAVPVHGGSLPGRIGVGSLSPTDRVLLRGAALRLGHVSPVRALAWLRHDAAVRSATLGTDRRTLAVHFRDAGQALILPAQGRIIRIPLPSVPRPVRPTAEQRTAATSPRALVLEPFATELQIGSSAGAVEVADLQAAGFQVDQAQDTAVTVATMATLPQYNVVYMHTHSGSNPSGEGVVATGELAGSDPAVGPLLADGSVTVVGVAGSTQQYYAITSRYVTDHLDRFPRNSILFLNGCSLLQGTAFWRALASRGLAVLVSWDNESTSRDNFLSAAAFFAEMDAGMAVQAAIGATRAAGYGISTVNGTTATLGSVGDGSITLQSAKQPVGSGGPPTATARPTATVAATTPPSTSTPTPTATAVSRATPTATLPVPTHTPPVLQMALKALVRPGGRQVIAVHTAPGAAIQAGITYPDGERTSLQTRADTAGTAQIDFVQPSSAVTRTQRRAAVTVEATSAGGTAVRTLSYRIGWSWIDIVPEPRRQRPGGSVVLWVHTRPSRLLVTLSVSRGVARTGRYQGRSGAAGWLRLPYHLASTWRSGQVAKVQGVVRVAGRVYRTHATIQVQ